jgi:5-methylthioadenosine/S-adenosylhomocysteine deaminase
VPTLIHLAESNDEMRVAQERRAASPVAYLESLGFLGQGVVGAHGVWVNDADIQTLRMRGVGVSHNPESNMKTASGVAPVPAYLRAGVAVGLGTDGAASNNDLDMFEAMRVAALLHKHETMDPATLPARTILEMATIRGARALGVDARIGSLEPKKRADLITVAASRARQTPMYDPISHLVYVIHGDDVQNSVVNGRVLMRNRKVQTLNEPEIIAEARSWAVKVRAAVKQPSTTR